MSVRRRIAAAALACASFALTLTLFEVALVRAGGTSLAIVYVALVVGLALGAGLACAGVLGWWLEGARTSLIALAALTVGLTARDLSWLTATSVGGVALITAAALGLERDLGRRPLTAGVLVASALSAVYLLWPRVSWRVGASLDLPEIRIGWPKVATDLVVLAASWGAAIAYRRLRSRYRRWPGEGVAALALLALIVAALAVKTVARAPSDAPAVASEGAPAVAVGPDREDRPTIILLVLDTVGAARLSIYGYSRPTTPQLAAFLARNERVVLYPLAFAPASWTPPSHASLFTGLLPSDHGVDHFEVHGQIPPPPRPLLAELLREQGYHTAAASANPMLNRVPDLFTGFDEVVSARRRRQLWLTPGERIRARWAPPLAAGFVKPSPPAQAITPHLQRMLGACDSRPCFVFANYMDAHSPYVPPRPFAGTWSSPFTAIEPAQAASLAEAARTADRYDEALLALDAALGSLLHELESTGVLERSWLFITSDHGEAFAEHGLAGHGQGLHNEQTRIPLLISPPRDVRLEPTDQPVSLLDVAATIAAVAGVERFGNGQDLRVAAAAPRTVALEFPGRDQYWVRWGPKLLPPSRAVVADGYKLIEAAGRWELYALTQDPGERVNLAGRAPEQVERLARLLPAGFPPLPAAPARGAEDPATVEPDPDRLQELEALGYVE